jgi:hypothetical protein
VGERIFLGGISLEKCTTPQALINEHSIKSKKNSLTTFGIYMLLVIKSKIFGLAVLSIYVTIYFLSKIFGLTRHICHHMGRSPLLGNRVLYVITMNYHPPAPYLTIFPCLIHMPRDQTSIVHVYYSILPQF